MSNLYSQWLDTCRLFEVPAISTDTAARIMAVLYEYGNNEGFTFNAKFLADKEYIEKRFHIYGTGVVDADFVMLLKGYIKELQDYQEAHKNDEYEGSNGFRPIAPDWAPRLLKDRYNMNFIG